jgi:hypothetical protein
MYLTNAFSLNMLNPDRGHSLSIEPIPEKTVSELVQAGDLQSAIGHAGLTPVLEARLGVNIPVNRISLHLSSGDVLIVAQATMPRLAEGQVLSAEEMRNIPLVFWRVKVK